MKDEIDISGCTTFEEVYDVISEWVHYYNYDRPQWDLLKLAPAEYYQYLMTGEYLYVDMKKGVGKSHSFSLLYFARFSLFS